MGRWGDGRSRALTFGLATGGGMGHFSIPDKVFLILTMPTYEYECTKCGHAFDAVQSMKDPHLKDCPKEACEGPVRRKIGRGFRRRLAKR